MFDKPNFLSKQNNMTARPKPINKFYHSLDLESYLLNQYSNVPDNQFKLDKSKLNNSKVLSGSLSKSPLLNQKSSDDKIRIDEKSTSAESVVPCLDSVKIKKPNLIDPIFTISTKSSYEYNPSSSSSNGSGGGSCRIVSNSKTNTDTQLNCDKDLSRIDVTKTSLSNTSRKSSIEASCTVDEKAIISKNRPRYSAPLLSLVYIYMYM